MGRFRQTIFDAYQRLQELPFPGHPESEQLAGLVLDLAEADGYVAGIAETVSGGGSSEYRVRRGELADLHKRFTEIKVEEEDREIYKQTKEYLDALEELCNLLQKV